MKDREKYYDEEIAPRLRQVAKLCKEAGVPMLATVWIDVDSSGTTRVPPPEPHPAFTLAHAAHRCHGNLDAMCIALARQVKPEHNSSIVLRLLQGSSRETPP